MENLFAQRFKELVKSSNMTYESLAKELGFKSKGTISKYACIKDVKLSTLLKIANYFNVSPIWLMGLTDDKHFEIKD